MKTRLPKRVKEAFSKIKKPNSNLRRVQCVIELKLKNDNTTISCTGYNQNMFKLHDYQCETTLTTDDFNLVEINNPYNIHAEYDALTKLVKMIHKTKHITNDNIKSIEVYTTTAPCVECIKQILFTLKKFNKKIIIYYGAKKETFCELHPRTNATQLIPEIVLRSQGVKTYFMQDLLDLHVSINSDIIKDK